MPKNLVVKGDKVAQAGVYHAVKGRVDPEVYVVWMESLKDMAVSAGFPQEVYEKAYGQLVEDAAEMDFSRKYEKNPIKPGSDKDGPRFRTDPKNTSLIKWGASASRRGDVWVKRFEPVVNQAGYTVESVFPIGQDPEMHGIHFVVVGRSLDPRLEEMDSAYATWRGIDWTAHPNPADRARGCQIGGGNYMMSWMEAMDDADERVRHDQKRYPWKPLSQSKRSGKARRKG